jgi:hypothetical protein
MVALNIQQIMSLRTLGRGRYVLNHCSCNGPENPLQMRMNFTGTGPWSTEKVSALSDELFVAQQSPCVGLTQSSTSSSIATQSTPATGISPPTLPTSSAAPSKTPSSTPYPSNARRVMRFSSPPTGHYDLILPIVSYPDDISDGGIEF